MEKVSDIDLLRCAKSSDLAVSSKAHLDLWQRYTWFIRKKYYQWINTFTRERVDFDDYLQEAYIAMANAIRLCDIDRMIEKKSNSFSTVLYFQLMKIKNRYDDHYNKYGQMLMASDLSVCEESDCIEDRYHGLNSLASKWVSATTIDDEQEKLNVMSQHLVEEYNETLDPMRQKICQLLIEREKISSIIKKINAIYPDVNVHEKIKEVRLGLKSFVEENAYV